MASILITGGAGFIGSRLALRLLDGGHAVTVMDNLSPQVHTADPMQSELYRSIEGKVRFIRGDVTVPGEVAAALQSQQVVVHLAAETGTGQSMYQIRRYCESNVVGTAVLLDLLANARHTVRRVVIASSRAVYGEGKYRTPTGEVVFPGQRSAADMSAGDFGVKTAEWPVGLVPVATDEESMIHPASVYGITKQVQEQLVMSVCGSLGIEAVAFRYQNVYGPGQSLSNPYTGILSIFANLILSGSEINIFEDGLESRDFVYIDDVVDATVRGIELREAAGGIFNVGSGKPVTVTAIAQALAVGLQRSAVTRVSGNFRLGDIRHSFACLQRIERILGFQPRISLEQGVGAFCRWVQAVGTRPTAYAQSLAEMQARGLFK